MFAKLLEKVPNRFESYVPQVDPFEDKVGRILSILYYVCTGIAIVILSLIFGLSTLTIQKTIPEEQNGPSPTLADYQRIKQYNPQCTCSNPSIPYSSFATLEFKLDTLCDAVLLPYVTTAEFTSLNGDAVVFPSG
jgi:hypothetical protein